MRVDESRRPFERFDHDKRVNPLVNISIVSSGHVSTTVLGCFADEGYEVINVNTIDAGKPPIREDGLAEHIPSTPAPRHGPITSDNWIRTNPRNRRHVSRLTP